MCVCRMLYGYTYVHVCVRMRKGMHVCIHTCVDIYIHMFLNNLYMHILHALVYNYIHMFMRISLYIRICIYKRPEMWFECILYMYLTQV